MINSRPIPPANVPVIEAGSGRMSKPWYDYFLALDKALRVPDSQLGDFANDAAANTGGVAVGRNYRTGSAIKVRVS